MDEPFNVTYEQFKNETDLLNQLENHRSPYVYLQLIFCVFGFFSNCLCVAVFTRPALSSSVNILLAALEASNAIMVVTVTPRISEYFMGVEQFSQNSTLSLIDYIFFVIGFMVGFVSNTMTVLIGIWRLVVVSKPFKIDAWCGRSKTKKIVAAIFAISLPMIIPYGLLYYNTQFKYCVCDEHNKYHLKTLYFFSFSSYSRKDNKIYFFVIGILFLLIEILPSLALAVITILILVNLRLAMRNSKMLQSEMLDSKASRSTNRENKITICLLLMLMLFLGAYITDTIASVMMLIYPLDELSKLKVYWLSESKVLILFCNASSIFFYYCMSSRFRKAIHSFVSKKVKLNLESTIKPVRLPPPN